MVKQRRSSPARIPHIEYLRAFKKLLDRDGVPPTMRDLTDEVGGLSTSTTQNVLWALAGEGYLERREPSSVFPVSSRSWLLTSKGRKKARQ